jgi:hypothetical protein
LPSGVRQYFLPVETSLEWAVRQAEEAEGTAIVYRDKHLVYRPRLLAQAMVRYSHTKSRLSHDVAYTRLSEWPSEEGYVDWDTAVSDMAAEDLAPRPSQDAVFAPLPSGVTARTLQALRREFADHIYGQERLTIWHNPTLKLYSKPGETENQFLRRCRRAAQEARDAAVEKLRDRYETKFDRLEDRLRREERELSDDEAEYEARKREEWLSAGESILGFLGGRRSSRAISIQSRKRRLTEKAKLDIEESEEEIQDLEEQIADLEAEWQEKETEENERWAQAIQAIEPLEIRPTRAGVRVEHFGLAWAPQWEIAYKDGRTDMVRTLSLSAFGRERG